MSKLKMSKLKHHLLALAYTLALLLIPVALAGAILGLAFLSIKFGPVVFFVPLVLALLVLIYRSAYKFIGENQ